MTQHEQKGSTTPAAGASQNHHQELAPAERARAFFEGTTDANTLETFLACNDPRDFDARQIVSTSNRSHHLTNAEAQELQAEYDALLAEIGPRVMMKGAWLANGEEPEDDDAEADEHDCPKSSDAYDEETLQERVEELEERVDRLALALAGMLRAFDRPTATTQVDEQRAALARAKDALAEHNAAYDVESDPVARGLGDYSETEGRG